MRDDQPDEAFISRARNCRDGFWSEGVEEALLYLNSKSSFSVRVEQACLSWWAYFHASPPEARPMGMAASFVSKSSIVRGMVPSWGSSPLSRSTCLASSQ